VNESTVFLYYSLHLTSSVIWLAVPDCKSALGAVALTLLAILIANHPLIQTAVTTHIPLFWRLDPIVYPYSSVSLQLTLWTSAAIVLVALVPLYKPHPWRTLDVLIFTQKRVVVAALGIAALGYFNYSFRLPRTTLAMTTECYSSRYHCGSSQSGDGSTMGTTERLSSVTITSKWNTSSPNQSYRC